MTDGVGADNNRILPNVLTVSQAMRKSTNCAGNGLRMLLQGVVRDVGLSYVKKIVITFAFFLIIKCLFFFNK